MLWRAQRIELPDPLRRRLVRPYLPGGFEADFTSLKHVKDSKEKEIKKRYKKRYKKIGRCYIDYIE